MPAQVMFSAFRILIEIARICGYSERDITIMTGIATDICYPVMAYNGDLIQHIGSNPSGQNLTVYINSVVNSLLFRSAFYNLRGVENKTKFRDICALMTYGDDVKGSVKVGNDDFNHLYCAEFFAKHDMVFTMPDKESTPTAFMRDVDADFLKRKNVFCAQTGCIMGALDEESIFKSLHSNLKSKANTKEKLAADNIDGALREWFNHGKGTYEMRRAQMREVAEQAGISHMCTLLDETFEERVEHWKDRYIRGIDPDDKDTVDDVELYGKQAGEYVPQECFVERIIPVVDAEGTVVNSFQVVNCGENMFLRNVACFAMVFALVYISYKAIKALAESCYQPQAGTYRRGAVSPPPFLLPWSVYNLMNLVHEGVIDFSAEDIDDYISDMTEHQFICRYVSRRIEFSDKNAPAA
jgi:hypothetical protein